MEYSDLYADIAERTGGDIYIGVVGPVRTGKSTLIKRFMELMILPEISDEAFGRRARDELPQSAAGRTIMTTEPKFVPEQAVRLELEDRTVELTALTDTGNTLTDPVTGQGVMVAEGERLLPLFAVSQRPSVQELRDPAGALERLTGAGGHFRLLPYRAVGVDRGLLLAVRVDRAVVDGEDRGAMVVALSPTPVSDGGGYGALLGEC